MSSGLFIFTLDVYGFPVQQNVIIKTKAVEYTINSTDHLNTKNNETVYA